MRQLLSGPEPKSDILVASPEGRPLAGPADGQDHARSGRYLQVEVAQVGIGGPSSRRADSLLAPRSQFGRQWLVVIHRAGAADRMVQEELAVMPAANCRSTA